MRKQILYRVLLSSPLIAFLIVTPIFFVLDYRTQTFIGAWSIALVAVLISWGTQMLVFYFFKKRAYPNWLIGLSVVGLVFFLALLTKFVAPNLTPALREHTGENFFMVRLILSASINLIIFLLLDLIYSQDEKLRLINENTQLQFQNLNSKYQLLKAQVNPHFMFNALNISKSLIKTKPNDAEKYIVGLSEFLRNSLNIQQKSISLQKELAHCQQYVDLQKVRFDNAIDYDVNIDKTYLNKQLPSFTMITLIENAIKHNAFSIDAPLKISVVVEDDYLYIKNEIRAKTGVISSYTGLSNLNERSQMLSGEEILIDNDGQTFSVKVKLVKA